MMTSRQRIDVFISSTSLDLPEYRRAVTEAILALGLFPSGMETWAVRDESAIALCRRKIDEAEIYLGIYAYRYGWTPDGFSGKSITELEYDWAGERGIPRLRFIMADAHPWPESEKEQGVAQEMLNAFKKRLKQEVVGFFTTPHDLKAQVIAALAGYAPKGNGVLLTPYLRALHVASRQSGLLRALDPRTSDPTYGGRGVTIDQVYTPLSTRQRVRRDVKGRILPELHAKKSASDRDLSALTAMEAANGSARLVLLGDPGSGKSTFVNYLTLCLSGALIDPEADWLARLQNGGWTHGALVPLVVVLRDFAQSVDVAAPPTANTLRQYIAGLVDKEAPDGANVIGGRALVLLDGLDEVPGERRAYVRDAIDLYVGGCARETRVIVTCRILSYADPQYRIPGFAEQTIAPLEQEQIIAFIGTWYSALVALGTIDRETAAQRTRELADSIRMEGLNELASNPMLLTVMALVHNHLGTLPREMARLYEACVELLLLRWKPNDARTLLDVMGIREDDLLRLVWEIAYDAHDQQAGREDTADIPQHAVEMIARRYVKDDAGKAQAFCEYVERRAGLLIGRGFDRYGGRIYTFPHRTFQEFLAGCHLSVNRFARAAAEHALRGSAWRETLLLATGNLVFNQRNIDTPVDAVSRILNRAAPRADDAQWRLYPLAGEMLLLVGLDNLARDEDGMVALRDTRAGLAALLDAGALPVRERAAAGRVLAQLGDPRPGVGLRPDGLPDMVWCDVPAGEFIMGSDDGHDDEKPRRVVRIDRPYRIARYPVTHSQFQAFVESGEYDDPRWWDGLAANERNRRVHEASFPYANHPRDRLNWYQAVAFTRWLTARYQAAGLIGADEVIRLPTEVEWERAARGTDGRIYPYGDEFDPAKGNTRETRIGMTSAVGMFPDGASPVEALEMSGNVWEWCLNEYEHPERTDIGGTARRVLRGGSFDYDQDYARAAARLGNVPGFRYYRYGARYVVAAPVASLISDASDL